MAIRPTRPILVTGIHRSGTGWVGSMIAASPSPPVAYLWEPFSVLHRPGILDVRFPLWFPYICPENAGPYLTPISDMLALRYRTGAELGSVRSPKDLGRLVRDRGRFARYRRQKARPLLKDPIAVFSAGWLADTFDMEVVVLVRHPAAFVNSVRSRGLSHPFGDFLGQPLLMRDVLAPFAEEIRDFATVERPAFDQGILLWRLVHHAILGYREQHPGWTFLRLEDVAVDPLDRFEALCATLGQTVDDRMRELIAAHSDPSNPEEVADPAALRRDSRASIVAWKSRLSEDEVRTIRDAVEPISRSFYGDEDW
jgi:hypothetical protein